MKFFPYSLIAAANGWDDSPSHASDEAETTFANAVAQYHLGLESLRSRVSKPAWDFFRNGYGETGLHDARLLSFSIGDGLAYAADGSSRYSRNRQRAEARVEFINYEQTRHYAFRLRAIRRSTMTFASDASFGQRRFGDLYTYELVDAGEGHLGLGFLFADGAEISLEFRTLSFGRKRLRRTSDIKAKQS